MNATRLLDIICRLSPAFAEGLEWKGGGSQEKAVVYVAAAGLEMIAFPFI